MAGTLNIGALQLAGAAILAAPAPAVPELELWAEDLRARFTPDAPAERHYGYGSSRPRGGAPASHLCFACHRFVAGKQARCRSCGYEHGGQNHDAQAIA